MIAETYRAMVKVQMDVLDARADTIRGLLQSWDDNEHLKLELAIALGTRDRLSADLRKLIPLVVVIV